MEYDTMKFCDKIEARNKQQLDEKRTTVMRDVYSKLNARIEKERE